MFNLALFESIEFFIYIFNLALFVIDLFIYIQSPILFLFLNGYFLTYLFIFFMMFFLFKVKFFEKQCGPLFLAKSFLQFEKVAYLIFYGSFYGHLKRKKQQFFYEGIKAFLLCIFLDFSEKNQF